jgi:hypothetical protein
MRSSAKMMQISKLKPLKFEDPFIETSGRLSKIEFSPVSGLGL